MTSLKRVKARATEVFHHGRSVYSCSNNGGLIGSSLFIRLVACNREEDIRYLHDKNGERSRAASDHAAHKHMQGTKTLKKAVAELMDCINKGISVSSYAYNDLLKWCANEKDLESVKQVHDSVKDSQMEQHPYVGTMLLKCYIECGRLETAEKTFNKLVNKSTVIWNMMISGHVKYGRAESAIQMYKQMRNEGGQPDTVTYMSVLKACAIPTLLQFGEEIHAHIIHDGFQEDVRVSCSLVQMYAKCGSIEDARAVFGKILRRNMVCWNVMIGELAEHGFGHEAFSLFLQMQREGFVPSVITYLSILNPRSSHGALEWVQKVHAHANRTGPDVRVESALVRMYAKSGSIDDARAVFDKMGRRNVVSWNVMIGELAEHGLGHEAFSLFLQMRREGFTPNAITYSSILNPRSNSGALKWVKEVHAHARCAGPNFDVQVENALVQMYSKSGSLEDAKATFDKMGKRDIVSWNVMIGELAEQGLGHEAFSLFLQMHREGFTPNAITYLCILNPCSSSSASQWVKKVHAHAMVSGLDVELKVGNALVRMYSKSGLIDDAKRTFQKMRSRDVVSYIVMISGLAQHGQGREALKLFESMKSEGVKPNEAVFVVVLSACSHAGLVEEGLLLLECMRRDYNVEPAVEHYTCMVDALGRAGRLEETKLFILNMPIKPNFVTWLAFLGACNIHRNLELAEVAARECLKLNPTEASPYVLLSNVYAAVGN